MNLFIVILWSLLITLFVLYKTYGKSGKVEPFVVHGNEIEEKETLTLLSINMAHGRGSGRNQILQSNKVIETYVEKIAQLIKEHKGDIVALQEADAPSWWSGGFSHVNRVAELSKMRFAVQGEHINGLGLKYGASLVSNVNVLNAHSQTFQMNIPTFSKGFVLSTCEWQDITFSVVSLHLDFARPSVRKRQLKHVAETLKKEGTPVIVMGDFNTMKSYESLPDFMEALNLHTWKFDDKSIITFPSLGGFRLDWVLVSTEFEIVHQEVLDEVVSDHRALKVVLKKRKVS